jgi:hypothetical protein
MVPSPVTRAVTADILEPSRSEEGGNTRSAVSNSSCTVGRERVDDVWALSSEVGFGTSRAAGSREACVREEENDIGRSNIAIHLATSTL